MIGLGTTNPRRTRARRAALVLPLLALASCSDGDADAEPSEPTAVELTEPDGRTTTLTPTSVECGPSSYDPDTEVVLVRLVAEQTALTVEVVPADVADGGSFDLPLDAGSGTDGPANASVFVGSERFQASSTEEESTGTLEVTRATCDPVALDLSIEATLGPERSDGYGVRVEGRISLNG
ncbi:hypothetical protein [Nocardioides sp.]|uniref:hypothetical protein n=1 Tax=Nocardioides sp. TaxID=35761 RepID=UPI003511171A